MASNRANLLPYEGLELCREVVFIWVGFLIENLNLLHLHLMSHDLSMRRPSTR